jgi:uncharacterized coiled-coil DUF342 family protein
MRRTLAATTAERDALKAEIDALRAERDELRATLTELIAARRGVEAAQAELNELYREREIARARATVRDPNAALN